jgi:hypothetical protein
MADDEIGKSPVILDEHRGMTAQKAANARRHLLGVAENQDVLRQSQASLDKFLLAEPARTWSEAAEKALYIIGILAGSAASQDPRHKQLIASVTEDFRRLTGEDAMLAPEA